MSDWLPSLNSLRAFTATARTLSFEKASRELGVTPAAVKQLVRKLEVQLGTSLIERSGRGLRLTAAGAAGLSDLNGGFLNLAAGVQKIRRFDRRSRLVLSVEPSLASLWLVPRLHRFQKIAPDVDVLINTSSHLIDIGGNEADIAIRFGENNREDTELRSYRLFNEVLAVFAGKPLTAQIGQGDSLSDLPLIDWDTTPLVWAETTRRVWTWDAWFRHAGNLGSDTQPRRRLTFADYNMAVGSAIAGQGLLLGSIPVLQDLLANGLLVQVSAQTMTLDVGYDLILKADTPDTSTATTFLRWVLSEIKQDTSLPVISRTGPVEAVPSK